MINIEELYEGIRGEGLNYGLPMTFVQLGFGSGLSSEDALKEIATKTKCKWICFLGKDTTIAGMGSLTKGLSSIGLYVEVECSGDTRTPGWAHTVDRWVVDFRGIEDAAFNYFALRQQDMIRFTLQPGWHLEDLEGIREYFEKLKLSSAAKYIRTPGAYWAALDSHLRGGLLEFVRKYERSRVYVST